MEKETKNYKLSIYLLKKDVTDFKQALKEDINIKAEYDLNEDISVEGKVIIGNTRTNEPNWRQLLQEGVDSRLPELDNTSNRALVFFVIFDRIFAIPFGYGKHLIKDECIDRDFGLKTALNIIDADKLLSVDKANFGDLTVLTKTQTSKKGNPDSFDIDIVRDLLRSVTGQPSIAMPGNIGNVITGNEGVYISPTTNLKLIPEILSSLKDEYEKETYKERFDWIDNIKTEKDPAVIEQLRKKLIADLKAKDTNNVHLAPPYIIEWETFDGISYTPKGDIYNEFEITDFYAAKEEILKDLDWNKLSKLKLFTKFLDTDERYGSSLWRFLNYETELDGSKYIFTLSNWYKVNKEYADEIYEYVSNFEETTLPFIDCSLGDNEGVYNEKLAMSNKQFILLDKKLVHSDLSRSGIEACDVMSDSKEFIHVKFRDSSATLSHLFSQGRVSSYSLRRDKTFRKNLRTKIAGLGFDRELIPLETKDVTPSDFTITFAIIESKKRSFIEALPFFSLINFRLLAEELSMIGFNVKVKKIEIV